MLFHRALAHAGYLVVSFDNQGTPVPKGAKWRQIVYGSVGDLSSRQQAAAVRVLAAARSYIDEDRISWTICLPAAGEARERLKAGRSARDSRPPTADVTNGAERGNSLPRFDRKRMA